jgi:predicted ATP-grasp superfamily ATP-dependent carboligase
MAESAARAGYEVIALDAFGDLDLERWATARSLPRDLGVPFSARAAARLARDVDCERVAYVASFENHPRAVRALAAGRELLGNPPAVLERVRDPLLLARALGRRGFPVPEVRASPPAAGRGRWLIKPRASGGGHGIAAWRSGAALPRHSVLQERITGVPGSIVFAAAGRRALPLGLSRQLIGGGAFGAGRFRYAGSILAGAGDPQFAEDETLLAAATHLAQAVTEEFDLVGVNGIDFVARDGVPVPVEVNPRYSASMELVERAYGISMFELHMRACRGELSDFDLAGARRGAAALGKAIVYARHAISAGETSAWLGDDSVRDVPHPGERISRRRPICTIFAAGTDAAACADALVRRAGLVYKSVDARRRSA